MNNEKFARENKRIIEGMGIGALVGPILALVMMYVKTAGSPQPFQIIMSMGAGLAFGLMIGGIMSASLVLNKTDRKSTRLNSSHVSISYAVFCLKKKKITKNE